jgi:hypothetical protein
MIHLSTPDPRLAALILLLILLCLLLVPIDLEGRVTRGGERPGTEMRVGWLFGRLHKDVFIGGERKPPERRDDQSSEKGEYEEEVVEEEGNGEAGRGRGSISLALEVLRTEGFFGNLARLLRGLLKVLRIRTLTIDMMIGLSDPAETGEAVGLLAAALVPLEALAPVRARIVPNFAEEVVAGSAEGTIRIVPIRIVPPLARFLISPPTWRAGWRAASAWRGKR